MAKRLIGIDKGGNLWRMGEVDPKTGGIIGEIVETNLEHIVENSKLTEKAIELLTNFSQPNETLGVGICAAGHIDEVNLIIKGSPNSRVKGEITFPRDMRSAGYDVVATNDMPAAAQYAARFGQGKGYENVCVITFSEGCNAAIVRSLVNVTKAEMGHHVYKPNGDLWCGCGEKGHLEPYVSGKGAEAIARQYFDMTRERNHPILINVAKRLGIPIEDIDREDVFWKVLSQIKTKDIYKAYKDNPKQNPQRAIREMQVEAIEYGFGDIVSHYNPVDIIVCMGGQTRDWRILFKGEDGAIVRYAREFAKVNYRTIRPPKIVKTKRKEIGVPGAAAFYLSNRGYK